MPRKQVHLVQRGVWDLETASMPLAMGYLKAMADPVDVLRSEFDIVLHDFGGADRALDIIRRAILTEPRPDIIASATHLENHERVSRHVGPTAAELEQTRVRAIPPPAALLESTEPRAATRTHARRVLGGQEAQFP